MSDKTLVPLVNVCSVDVIPKFRNNLAQCLQRNKLFSVLELWSMDVILSSAENFYTFFPKKNLALNMQGNAKWGCPVLQLSRLI